MRIVFLLYRLDVGGLETVVVNLINRLPPAHFEYHIIALTQCGAFKKRIQHPQVHFHDLNKKAGKDWLVWFRLWQLLKKIKPDLVHTCNIGTLEGVIPAFFAGRPITIHAEHGRDSSDPHGENKTYIRLRKILNPFVDAFVCVSQDLHAWLTQRVSIPETKVHLIINGIDTQHFTPGPTRSPLPHPGFANASDFIIGTVGRLWPIKDQANLVTALASIRHSDPEGFQRCRLVLMGDGPQRQEIESLAHHLNVTDKLWITGWRDDIAQLLRCLDLFVLPSLAEGTPLTILEAMATGLPIIATRVGGVADLLTEGHTGTLVPPGDPNALAQAILTHLHNPAWSQNLGKRGRYHVETHHSLETMVESYRILFQNHLLQKTK
ncbi:MAG: TIGR03088 family PEP-CTERM/XrtA system glycosyltransferase [Magnetococcales bacterium]|nr:TIGR03088 family PEP-CTERM/XrtA system glycosyltransferase [Magnetococcales bacterium]